MRWDGENVSPQHPEFSGASREDEDQDIFVHMETVRRGGLTDLVPDQPLRARIASGRKGPLAVEVEPA